MHASSLEVGRTYYRITFADADLTMPAVRPMVFAGVNVLDGDKETSTDIYYFQDTVSVVRFGLITDSDVFLDLENEGGRLYSFEAEEIGSSLVDLKGVGELIEAASRRHQDLGQPRLQKAPGGWK